MSPEKRTSDNTVKVLVKAIHLLDVFTSSKPEWRLGDLSEATELDPSTARRILCTLKMLGLVEQNPETRKYRLGLKLLMLGGNVVAQMDMLAVSRPVLHRLASECGETAYVAVWMETEVLFVDVIESTRTIRLTARIGQRLPAHSTASGKVFLAFLPKAALESHLSTPLVAYTPKTITDPVLLHRELEIVRRDGYACAFNEHEVDASAVSVPIRSRTGQVLAAITLSGPSARIRRSQVPQMARSLKHAAAEIAASLTL